jgi:hypothetical protein
LDVTGWQWATSASTPGLVGATFFLLTDPTLTCSLSAAVPGGIPVDLADILANPLTIGVFPFYTSVPCAFPTVWFFDFVTPALPAPNPELAEGNLIVGWQEPVATPIDYQLGVASIDEGANAAGWSWISTNPGNGGVARLLGLEHEIAIRTDEPSITPEVGYGGVFQVGGTGGFSPVTSPGTAIRFRTMDTSNAGGGLVAATVCNVLFQASSFQCHVPGTTVLGVGVPLNVDPLWLITFGLLVGPALSPLGPTTIWNPGAGLTPGGESVSPALPLGNAGLLGLRMCFASMVVAPLGPPPLVRAASNGSELTIY